MSSLVFMDSPRPTRKRVLRLIRPRGAHNTSNEQILRHSIPASAMYACADVTDCQGSWHKFWRAVSNYRTNGDARLLDSRVHGYLDYLRCEQPDLAQALSRQWSLQLVRGTATRNGSRRGQIAVIRTAWVADQR